MWALFLHMMINGDTQLSELQSRTNVDVYAKTPLLFMNYLLRLCSQLLRLHRLQNPLRCSPFFLFFFYMLISRFGLYHFQSTIPSSTCHSLSRNEEDCDLLHGHTRCSNRADLWLRALSKVHFCSESGCEIGSSALFPCSPPAPPIYVSHLEVHFRQTSSYDIFSWFGLTPHGTDVKSSFSADPSPTPPRMPCGSPFYLHIRLLIKCN